MAKMDYNKIIVLATDFGYLASDFIVIEKDLSHCCH